MSTTRIRWPHCVAALDCGVNFIDTADVYGMGRSERLIAQLKRERKEEIVVATKGRTAPFRRIRRMATTRKLTRIYRRQSAESFHRLPRSGAAALPAYGRLLPAGVIWRDGPI